MTIIILLDSPQVVSVSQKPVVVGASGAPHNLCMCVGPQFGEEPVFVLSFLSMRVTVVNCVCVNVS